MPQPDRFQRLGVPLATRPMEAKAVAELPEGEGWQFEPKWDGFRCLTFRDGDAVALMSKSGKPLERFFPELVDLMRAVPARRFVADGEIVLPLGGTLSFAALQARLHPAASRVARLSRETPAEIVLFDCLQAGDAVLTAKPLDERRTALERFGASTPTALRVSPHTLERTTAQDWLLDTGGALDGVVAKRRDAPYRAGERAMLKRKLRRTADCVVGGYRDAADGKGVGSLLLGLYDEDGRLDYVGFSSSFTADEHREIAALLEPLRGDSAFTGNSPGGASRWSKTGKAKAWTALKPERVVEVGYDQVTGGRFRHGTTFLRWRVDKAPAQCTSDQLCEELGPQEIEALIARLV